ncbi:hypothetical protein IC229_28705 [Spirosoma sp. BT702]|uniref:Uncharacterized protein n=1 Tax=Spirosoma profusum TaxID=2771354 RepID=A0A927AUJ6_9BACT|nr:hypothetical protein [Spirosoma profusum]MBD2704652.1 hypothetical protein [Spirosoma profusum]
MKPKTDETPDEWIRQTLSQLPDAPPPGSSFDPERLWAQLRPELQQTPVRRRIGWTWWVAAACLSGLIWSWFAWNQPNSTQKQVATYQFKRKVVTPAQKPDSEVEFTTSKPIFAVKSQPKKQRKYSTDQPTASTQSIDVAPATSPAETLATLPDAVTVANVATIAEKLPEPPKPNVARTTSKRRFKVMHENELRAEEEAAPQLYHTDNFVRMGTGRRESNVADSRQPTLIMPLTTKSNQ